MRYYKRYNCRQLPRVGFEISHVEHGFHTSFMSSTKIGGVSHRKWSTPFYTGTTTPPGTGTGTITVPYHYTRFTTGVVFLCTTTREMASIFSTKLVC